MSEAKARAEAARLKTHIEAAGLKCSIELQIGRPYADRWYTPKLLQFWHHTASYRRQGATPSLNVCKYGRGTPGTSGYLPGPLCNGYIGNDRVFRIITMGLANHPGAGGPITIDGVTLPKDSARISSFGVEVEGGYEHWQDDMLEAMGRASVGLARWMGRPLTSQLEHKTWTTRKDDRYEFAKDRSTGIALTKKWAAIIDANKGPVGVPPGAPDMSPLTISRWCINHLANSRDPVSGTCRVDCDRVMAFASKLDPRLQVATKPAYEDAVKAGNWMRAGELLEYAIKIIQSRAGLHQDGFFGADTGRFMAGYGYTITTQ